MTTREADWQSSEIEELIAKIVSLRDPTEGAAFLRDLCTRKELDEMSRRWQAVKLLDRSIPYREISEQTGLSTATITRINQWLQHGTGGYRAMLDRERNS